LAFRVASISHSLQELRELGVQGTLFRLWWEAKLRGMPGPRSSVGDIAPNTPLARGLESDLRRAPLPFTDPAEVAAAVADRIPHDAIRELDRVAKDVRAGRILCFGGWQADFGNPIDWHLNPATGARWAADQPWRKVLAVANGNGKGNGDIKFTWELGRFPHAYHLARAAAFRPAASKALARVLNRHIESFSSSNPYGVGVHWSSGQEIVVRLLAWIFGLRALLRTALADSRIDRRVACALYTGAAHLEAHLGYAKRAVYNNHLLAEALGLLAAGMLLPSAGRARTWEQHGRALLEEQAERQFYADGAYIQQSHNYHRAALQYLLWASCLMRAHGRKTPASWLSALERSLDLLVAHQNGTDGRVPNYGANDGSEVVVLSCCDFADMRPTLQTVSLLVRGERLYPAGPWDEAAAWWLGPKTLDTPLKRPDRRSVSFAQTGFHVLRSRHHDGTFAAFRCGSLKDRYSQIDMLHLDVWWRGHNVLVDAGSFQYNGARRWHDYFTRTGAHNTVEVDGRDQMLHYRRFKVLYWTQADLLRFEDRPRWAVVEGEHYGYRRHPGRCVHRRSVLFLKDAAWVVVDRIFGSGEHTARLHWLGGEFPWTADPARAGFTLNTPDGEFTVRVFDERGAALGGDVAAGQEFPPRGWLSRYYGEKVPVPSLAVSRAGVVPLTFVSVLAGSRHALSVHDGRWTLVGDIRASFSIDDDGRFTSIETA
jgi:asparagine synthase (glutamine-hydrolysing)